MANELITDLSAASSVADTDLLFVGNPSTGELKKATKNLIVTPQDNDWLQVIAMLGSSILACNVGCTPADVTGSGPLTDQRITFECILLKTAATITGVKWLQNTQGNYTANNYNGIGLYSYSGGTLSLQASSTNDGNIWKAAGDTLGSKAFSSTYNASAGIYWIAKLYCRSASVTPPATMTMPTRTGTATSTMDYSNSTKISALLNSQTSLPSSVAMSALTSNTTSAFLSIY